MLESRRDLVTVAWEFIPARLLEQCHDSARKWNPLAQTGMLQRDSLR